MTANNELPPLFLVISDGEYASSEGAILGISTDFFDACRHVYDKRATTVLMFKGGKATLIAKIHPHWFFYDLSIYNPFKYEMGDAVQFRDGKGNLRVGNIDQRGIFGAKKPLPPFASDVIEYHANGVRVMQDDLKPLRIEDSAE